MNRSAWSDNVDVKRNKAAVIADVKLWLRLLISTRRGYCLN